MSIDLAAILQKGTLLAEQATAEDRAGNYEVAADAYIAAVEWFRHATKYGTMNPQMKQAITSKAKSYVTRAEELRNKIEKPAAAPIKAKATTGPENSEQDPDLQQMMKKFEGTIVTNPDVSFDDVVGLEQAKVALKEAVILPVKYPKLFRGKRKPWTGILLYGPPGTGKSYLAKAVATECKSTFISVTSADLLSKWLGEGEKSVKCLFKLARERKPCIIFIDEVDALCGERNDTKTEAASRLLTEFLVQMQGVGVDNTGLLVLGATNIPWSLDTAMRRRFEKRIYIPLPEINERAAMFKTNLGAGTFHMIKDNEWMILAQKAEQYSGADIGVVCREALLRPIRRLCTATHFKKVQNPNPSPDEPNLVWLACSPGDADSVEMTLDKVDPDELCEPPVIMSDMLAALATQKATVSEGDLVKYVEFTKNFGQEGS